MVIHLKKKWLFCIVGINPKLPISSSPSPFFLGASPRKNNDFFVSFLPQLYSATIRAVHNNKTYSLEELNGQILSYGKTTNANNYLIPITLEIDNTDDFVAGGFVELFLKYRSETNSIVIPNEALIEEQGNFFVFVQVHPELFEKREVKIGDTDGQSIEIKSGLRANERIVSEGAILIKLAQATGALDAHSGHVH